MFPEVGVDPPVFIYPGGRLHKPMVLQRENGHFPVLLSQFDQTLIQPDYILELDIDIQDPMEDQ